MKILHSYFQYKNTQKSEKTLIYQHFFAFFYGGDTRIRTGDQSFADSCLTTWLYRRFSFSTMLPDTEAVTHFVRTATATWLYRRLIPLFLKNRWCIHVEQVTGIGPVT